MSYQANLDILVLNLHAKTGNGPISLHVLRHSRGRVLLPFLHTADSLSTFGS